METVDWCSTGGDHCWHPKIYDVHHEYSGDDDCCKVTVTMEWREECLKCLAVRQPVSASAEPK